MLIFGAPVILSANRCSSSWIKIRIEKVKIMAPINQKRGSEFPRMARTMGRVAKNNPTKIIIPW